MLGRFTGRHGASRERDETPVPEARREPVLVEPGLPKRQSAANEARKATPDVLPEEENALLRPKYLDAKVRLHRRLIDEINLSSIDKIPEEDLRNQVQTLVSEYVIAERLPLNANELVEFGREIFDEMVGLGPIEPLLKDPTVSDILINTHRTVYVERFGQLEPTPIRFKDRDHLVRIINKIVGAVGRRVDESQPLCDARLSDGSRINVAVGPVAVDGPLVSIRKFAKQAFTMERLIGIGSICEPISDLLTAAVAAKITMLISGGTGSGKTTMLNALSNHISPKERLITIEDSAELQLQQPHVGRMETRPPNTEGKGEIRQRELVKNALRMRPDRIIVGEVRGDEAFDMLQAMNTGHEGSMTTIHANTSRDALARLEQMVGMAGFQMSQSSIRSQIASAIRLVIQLQRQTDGTRRVMAVSEITGMEGEVLQMQDIFRYVRRGVDEDGKVVGEFRATGIRPKFLEIIQIMGIALPQELFDPNHPL